MPQNKKKAVDSYLVRLMAHVIKWITQPYQRSVSWVRSIRDSRNKIKDIQRQQPSITDEKLEKKIEEKFEQAKRDAEKEMGQETEVDKLDYKQVFEDEYQITEEDKPEHQKKNPRKK